MRKKGLDLEKMPVSIRFKKGQISAIKEHARRLAYKEHREVTYVELIRKVVENAFPIRGKK